DFVLHRWLVCLAFFFRDPPPPEIYPLSLHDALPILVGGRRFEVTSRKKLLRAHPEAGPLLPGQEGGLECAVLVDDQPAALLRFRDTPRSDGRSFIDHLGPKHRFDRVMLVSGDRESEVRYLAEAVGITEVHFSQTPEQKVDLVRAETAKAPTLFMGDGIND